MTRWEYCTIDSEQEDISDDGATFRYTAYYFVNGEKTLTEDMGTSFGQCLARLGFQGWEMLSFVPEEWFGIALFKRKVED